ncbi:2OG-Fe(II) oxygenase [Bordetella genomosp. 12]|uniref:Proline hydroxylase n=1 Tax=Bordetella genomosp. 12 TaxID=463035 RepID=A0A261VWJ0_9BORD|nr:2OG-Fe(II) oxygenase [Bordetella genomosp. 12]OZI77970.1 proline hydroxylase [Bordetella genomosp. 12]
MTADYARRIEQRLDTQDWHALRLSLDAAGRAVLPALLRPAECRQLAQAYDDDTGRYRSRIVMARHGFGRGEYRYFAYPLPPALALWRTALYARLAPIARTWGQRLGLMADYPDHHADYLARCHLAGQTRPTPLILRYRKGDYNCLHQDVYGEQVFPLQCAVLLSAPGQDFTGGEFVMTEQRAGQPAQAEVLPLQQGDALIFAVHHRPAAGPRGWHRRTLRHGVAAVRAGERHTLGIIFHDAA